MVKFFVVRHGQSLGNAGGVFVGQNDIDLSELGHMQAEKTGIYLKDKKINIIYSSDLMRCYHTAEHIAHCTGAAIVSNKNLREINAGLWQGNTFDYLEEHYENYKVWLSDIGRAVCDGGESVETLQSRINAEFVKIADKNQGLNVCVVTHATPIRVMNCIWNKIPVCDAAKIPWVSNCSVCEVEYDNGVWRKISLGADEHLKELKSTFPSNV